MSMTAKTDYIGLARTGLEACANQDNASNQLLEIPSSIGDIIGAEKYGSVKNPHVDYKITAALTLSGTGANKVRLGDVYNQTQPFALKSITVSTGAGTEPTFGADAVQIEADADSTRCVYPIPDISLSPARHANTFGCVGAITESASLALQSGVLTLDCEIDPSTINGVPKASDAVKGKATVKLTLWTNNDTTAPTVTASTGWQQTGDWACTGSDGAMYVWEATFTKYLTSVDTTANNQ